MKVARRMSRRVDKTNFWLRPLHALHFGPRPFLLIWTSVRSMRRSCWMTNIHMMHPRAPYVYHALIVLPSTGPVIRLQNLYPTQLFSTTRPQTHLWPTRCTPRRKALTSSPSSVLYAFISHRCYSISRRYATRIDPLKYLSIALNPPRRRRCLCSTPNRIQTEVW